MTEDAELCKVCGGKCCRRPWMNMEEYTRLVLAIGNDAAQAAAPIFIMGGWQFTQETCPGLTETGCILPYADRPLACRVYPFVPIQIVDQGVIPLLAVQTCPFWEIFGREIENVKKELMNDAK